MMREFGIRLVCLVELWLVSCAIGHAGDGAWPHFRGPDYDGVPEASSLTATSVSQVWQASVHTGFSSMSIVGDRLYTMGNQDDDDIVTSLDVADGREVWRFRYPCKLDPNMYQGGPSATPTVDADRVYTISKFGDIFCLNAQTGEKVWQASAASYRPKIKRWWGFAGSPTVVGDLVLFNVGSRGLGLNKTTGQVVWSSKPGTSAYASIIPLPDSFLKRPAIVVLTNDTIQILDPADGKPVAEVESPFARPATCNGVTPVMWDGDLYVTHALAGLSRMSLSDGTLKSQWLQREPAMNWRTFNHRVYHDGRIYFLSRQGLCCLDAQSGEVAWEDEDYTFGNLLVAGDSLLILDEEGQLIWGNLDGGRFQETARHKILDGRCWAYPVLSRGRLYARNAEGTLVCVEFK